ncbi:MAG: PIN domain-containing protein [Candidatus Acidiferrum sp.]
MRVYFDTTVLVAGCVEPHPHYSQSIRALRSAREKKLEGHISGHALAEAYSVLTRTPFRPPIYPGLAWKILEEDILPYFEIVTITPRIYQETIRECAEKGWIGGRIHDAIHLRCAREADCERIYTFNVRHFQQLAPDLAQRIGAP